MPGGRSALNPSKGARGVYERLGLDGLHVGVGAVRSRLVLGLERRRLAARGARAREDEERLGDELCEGSEIPGVSVTVGRQSLEARGFSIRRSRRWLRDVDRRR